MDTSADLPGGGISDGTLARLAAGTGPFLTVYLGLDPSVERAGERSRLRWDAERAAAAADGAPEAALAAVDPAIADAHRFGVTLAAVVDGAGRAHVEHLSERVPDLAQWARLPSLAPLIAERQHDVPYLIVDADREGADLTMVTAPGDAVVEHDDAASGEAARKVAAGGWSQHRYQQRAENSWRERAASVAGRTVDLVDREHPRVVLVAGDVRAVEMLERALPDRVRSLIRHVEGGRAAGASDAQHAADEHDAEIRRLVATAAAEETVALARRLEQELGRHEHAVAGAAATVEALARGQVHTLLVHDDPDDVRNAFVGDEPVAIGLEPEDLPAPGPEGPMAARLVDACIRAAFGGGATVRVVPMLDALPDGIGALLRWPS